MKTCRLVRFWISCFSLSTSVPLRPMMMPGPRGVDVDLQVVRRALGLDARHAGVRKALLQVLAQRQVLVQQLRVVAVREPARAPGLVEAEPESVRVNLLTHEYLLHCPSYARRACRFLARLPRARRLFRRACFAPCATARDLQRPLGHVHRQVRGALHDAERAAHRRRTHTLHRRPLVGVARRDIQPIDVAAEAVLLLQVGDRRAQHLRQLARDRLARELQRRQRLVDVLAANQLAHQPRLLGRRAHAARCCLCFDCHRCPSPRRGRITGRHPPDADATSSARRPAPRPPPSRSSSCGP